MQRIALDHLPWQRLLPAAFLLLGLLYLYAAPNFEASDTVQHIGMIKWIAETGQLPLQSPEQDQLYGQEASQPPLYYLLMAALWNAFDTSDFAERYLPSPFTTIGKPAVLGNKNLVIYRHVYPPRLEGSSLALLAIRALSLGMGALTVYAVVQSARALAPTQPQLPLLAGALTAFNPQFVFISASVSNDTLVNMLAALATWQTLCMLRQGFRARRSLLLALLLGLLALSKLSGLVVAAGTGLAALWLLQSGRDTRGFALLLSASALSVLLIAGWWYLRNITLYGELLGTQSMLDHFGRRAIPPLELIREEFEGLRISYWAVFGAFNILADELFYRLMDALSLLGALGLPLLLSRERHHRGLLRALAYLALLLGMGGAMLLWWSTQTWASTGRLLFPYITSISLLLALGLRAWRVPAVLVALPLLLVCASLPFTTIMPNYDHPPAENPPASASKSGIQWGDIRLSAAALPAQQEWQPGERVPLTLYWRALAQSPLAYALQLRLLDARGQPLQSMETWPGWGTMPHPWMTLQQNYRDDYVLEIPATARKGELLLEVDWYIFPDGPALDAQFPDGTKRATLQLPLGAIVSA